MLFKRTHLADCASWGLAVLLVSCAARQERTWSWYNAGDFGFALPPGMKKTSLRGIDSNVSEFKGGGIVLMFDYGFFSNSFADWPASTRFEDVTIDRKGARIGTAHASFGRPFEYSTQVYFRDARGDGSGRSLTMLASCRTARDCDLAKQIFASIRFKTP